MIGLFATLNLGARSMQAQQTGVELAGQNLANINNPSYARQQLVLATSTAVDTAVGPQGTGVEVAGIQQVRDPFLDLQIQSEGTVSGYWAAQQAGLQNVQSELNEFLNQSSTSINSAAGSGSATTGQGLSAQLTSLFNAFQSVSADPTSLSARQGLVSQAQTLASGFNQISARLSSVNDTLNKTVTDDVEQTNQLLQDIADLNGQIASAEAGGGGAANDLRDLREQKLESLTQLADFKITNEADGTVTIASGSAIFVSGNQYRDSLETYDMGGGQLGVKAMYASPLGLSSGSIYGTIAARDGTLTSLRNGLDTLASQLITQVNSVYSTGYDLNGNTGANFFTGTSAATIGVNSALQNEPSQVQAAGTVGATGDNTIALALAQMANTKQPGLNNQTFNDAYGTLVVNMGNDLANANDQVSNQSAVMQLLQSQRDSVSGVSMEEELSNLITFQKAYGASAKIVSTVDQMLDTLLNMKQ